MPSANCHHHHSLFNFPSHSVGFVLNIALHCCQRCWSRSHSCHSRITSAVWPGVCWRRSCMAELLPLLLSHFALLVIIIMIAFSFPSSFLASPPKRRRRMPTISMPPSLPFLLPFVDVVVVFVDNNDKDDVVSFFRIVFALSLSHTAIVVFVVFIIFCHRPNTLHIKEWLIVVMLDLWSCTMQQPSHHNRARRNCTSPSLPLLVLLIGGGGMEQNDPPCRLPNIEHSGLISNLEICQTIMLRSKAKNLQCAIPATGTAYLHPLAMSAEQTNAGGRP